MTLIAFDDHGGSRRRTTNVSRFVEAYQAVPGHRERVVYVRRRRWRPRTRELRQAYRSLANQESDERTGPDDRVDIIGAGRGAATALDLANLIGRIGVSRPRRRRFRRSPLGWGWDVDEPPDQYVEPADFLGLFDLTLRTERHARRASIGANAPRSVFHVMALDEFRPRRHVARLSDQGAAVQDSGGKQRKEVWFAGDHRHVVGRRRDRDRQTAAAADSFLAMVEAARSAGVALNSAVLRDGSPPDVGDAYLPMRVRERRIREKDWVHGREPGASGYDPTAEATGRFRWLVRLRPFRRALPRAVPEEVRVDETGVGDTPSHPYAYVEKESADGQDAVRFEERLGDGVWLGRDPSRAEVIVVVWTRATLNSEVKLEVAEAAVASDDRELVQVVLDDVEPPFGLRGLGWFRVDAARDMAGVDDVIEVVAPQLGAAPVSEESHRPHPRHFSPSDVEERIKAVTGALDAPAVVDTLNRAPLASVVAARLREVRPMARNRSINVLIEGPWGSGKSSLINLIEKEINPDRSNPSWMFVRFDAWRQQRVGPPWWALMTALRSHIIGSMTARERLGFWFRERAAAMGAAYYLALMLLVALVVAIVAAGGIDFLEPLTAVITGVAVLWSAVFVVGKYLTLDSARMASLFVRSEGNPMEDVAAKFRWLAGEAGRPIVLVVDDLDRCDRHYVVQLLDSIQTLTRDPTPLHRQRHGKDYDLFVLVAADGGWLRESYREQHSSLVDIVTEPGRGLGDQFMSKIFDFSLTVPEPSQDRRQSMLEDLVEERDVDSEELRSTVERTVAELEEYARRLVDAECESDILAVLGTVHDDAVRDLLAAQVLDRLNAPDIRPDTEAHLRQFDGLLGGNPRVIKRFVLEYRVNRALRVVSGEAPTPEQLAVWSALRVRLPEVAQALEADPELLTDWKRGRARAERMDAAMQINPKIGDRIEQLTADDIRACSGSTGYVRDPEGFLPTPRKAVERLSARAGRGVQAIGARLPNGNGRGRREHRAPTGDVPGDAAVEGTPSAARAG